MERRLYAGKMAGQMADQRASQMVFSPLNEAANIFSPVIKLHETKKNKDEH
jgi:hypothetical protein